MKTSLKTFKNNKWTEVHLASVPANWVRIASFCHEDAYYPNGGRPTAKGRYTTKKGKELAEYVEYDNNRLVISRWLPYHQA
jgi:hypothetical protein